ncbi:14843_t:CDS:2, partial [Cetraspora pellucida]
METISTQSLCNYIENLISNVENNNRISFEIHINLNDDIFSEVEPNDLKSIVRIIVDEVEEAILKLRYDIIHEKLEDVSTPEEIKQEICTNLYLDPIQILFVQDSYKTDEDHVISALTFLRSNHAPDKDFAEINTAKEPEEAAAEFSFINPKFKPELNCSDSDYYQVCPLDLRKDIMNLIRKHFNMHPKIPINANSKCLTSAEIREHAVLELYSFCVEHNL